MSLHMLDELIPVRRYVVEEDDNGSNMTEEETFVTTEADDGEVSLHISPRTDDVVTVSLSPEGVWRLIRQLAASAVACEPEEG